MKRRATEKPSNISLWVMGGNLNGKCEDCGANSVIEYLGLDLIFPEFKVCCPVCRTHTRMKVYMRSTKLYPIPYRGRRAFDREHEKQILRNRRILRIQNADRER